ncbi:MAG: hypothetical protein OEY94_05500 [Alphaproteobacteria bacterium]|nr:hypothetical protein [Alphaproteobacteria bacterium]
MDSRAKGDKPYQTTSDMAKLLEQAEATKPSYDVSMQSFLDDLKAQNPNQFNSVVFNPAKLKTEDRILDKVASDYNGNANEVADFVRGTFTADTPEELLRVQEAMEDKFEIVRVKDNIVEARGGGV